MPLDSPHLPPMQPILREIFAEIYRYRQRYQNPTADPAFWQRAAADMEHLNAKYAHPLCTALLIACYEDIEREYKERSKT